MNTEFNWVVEVTFEEDFPPMRLECSSKKRLVLVLSQLQNAIVDQKKVMGLSISGFEVGKIS